MIVGNELRAWAADRERQRRSNASMKRFAARWNSGAVHDRFTAELAKVSAKSAEAVAEAVRSLFADDQWVDSLIGSLASAMRRDPYFEPPFGTINSDIHSGLLVFQDDAVAIAACVSRVGQLAAKKNAKRGATSIGFTGQIGIIKFVKSGGARLSFWEAPPITGDFTAASSGQCIRTGTRSIEDGEILAIDGRFQAYVIEHATSNLVMLQASITRDQAPLTVEYDSRTHQYVGCSATDDTASRIQMITTLIRKLGSDHAFEAVAALLDHDEFFVRWHVMRELLGIDAAAALPHLRRMAGADPHPDARRAARQVLDRMAGHDLLKAA